MAVDASELLAVRSVRPACPSCAGTRVRRIGAIPASPRFAGRTRDIPLPPGTLYRCRACLLAFRSPRPDREQLNEMYAAGASDTWAAAINARPDWDLAAAWIAESHPTGKVLDVGCFDGGFSSLLTGSVERYGVEIHAEAAHRAAQLHDVAIVGADYSELTSCLETYDCIVSFDMIEHVGDPQELLTVLASRLRDGGSLIIGTGNADAPTWRFMRGHYWYCYFPEHISFISPRWAHRAATLSGLRVHRIQRLSRGAGYGSFATETAKNVTFRVMPKRLASGLRRRQARKYQGRWEGRDDSPPMWASSRDHFVVELRKEPPS